MVGQVTFRIRTVLTAVLAVAVVVAVAVFVVVRPFEVAVPLRIAFDGTGRVDPYGQDGPWAPLTVNVAATNDGTEPIRVYVVEPHEPAELSEFLNLETRTSNRVVRPGETMRIPLKGAGRCPFNPPASFDLEVTTGFDGGAKVVRRFQVGPVPNALQRIANLACDLPGGAQLSIPTEITTPYAE
jgi:hypothetical protein